MFVSEVFVYGDEQFYVHGEGKTYILKDDIDTFFVEGIYNDVNLVEVENKEDLWDSVFTNHMNENYKILVLVSEQKIVGKMFMFLNSCENFANVDENTTYIVGFSISETRQNKGLGTFFLNEIEEIFSGYTIRLGVEKENKRAYHLYNKLGYKMYKENYTDSNSPLIFDVLEKEV